MGYSPWEFERVNSGVFSEALTLLNKLVTDKKKLEIINSIMCTGSYNGFGFYSGICTHEYPVTESRRRLAMVSLFLHNPETFHHLVENKICLFHGTDANALPSILKYGLNSEAELQKLGINVTTGEFWSKTKTPRNWVSFTDLVDLAQYYSVFGTEGGDKDLSFPVLIGTTVDDVNNAGWRFAPSCLTEVAVKKNYRLIKLK